jgi:four helix bundle protein
MNNKSYKDLEVWQEAMALVEDVYRLSSTFPKNQRYSLCQQVEKAASSVPSNIAEGHGRRKDGEFMYHLRVARGSLCEVETQMLLAQRLKFIDADQMATLNERIQLIGRLLNGLLRYLSKGNTGFPETVRPMTGETDQPLTT